MKRRKTDNSMNRIPFHTKELTVWIVYSSGNELYSSFNEYHLPFDQYTIEHLHSNQFLVDGCNVMSNILINYFNEGFKLAAIINHLWYRPIFTEIESDSISCIHVNSRNRHCENSNRKLDSETKTINRYCMIFVGEVNQSVKLAIVK